MTTTEHAFTMQKTRWRELLMTMFDLFEKKMQSVGLNDAVIRSFRRNYEALLRQETGLIPESEIESVENLPSADQLDAAENASHLLSQLVMIKLNGGLGTSMGLQAAKSLLDVKPGLNFIDLMVRQTLDLRQRCGHPVRLLLMNSFSTSQDTLDHLQRYTDKNLASADEVEMMQNQIPKIDAATQQPVTWPQDPSLEWCPPGHGDLYPALVGSGWLDKLLDQGIRYAFVSNSDNLGAIADEKLLQHFAQSGAPFMMEVTRRTAADRKGGHLAMRRSDGQLLLREVAQCPKDDEPFFQDIERHAFFNTNSIWLRLDVLKEKLAANDGVLPLPMIVNKKTVDPRDSTSPAVVQLEIAMGAAIECFEGAIALEVPRSRFAPVKTTADLFALRSDAYEISEEGQVALHPKRAGIPPVISLSDEYKLVDSLDDLGLPSLVDCDSLRIEGPIFFTPNTILRGDVEILNRSDQRATIDGVFENQKWAL